VLKLRAARQRMRRRDGRCEGRKPYGFHPNEHAVLEHMKDLRRKPVKADRLSFDGIAQHLNAERPHDALREALDACRGARGVVRARNRAPRLGRAMAVFGHAVLDAPNATCPDNVAPTQRRQQRPPARSFIGGNGCVIASGRAGRVRPSVEYGRRR